MQRDRVREKAAKMRGMTDEQLVRYVEDRVEKARSEGLNKGRRMARWVSAGERLPSDGQACLACWAEHGVMRVGAASFDAGGAGGCPAFVRQDGRGDARRQGGVRFWMALPPIPRQQGGGRDGGA